MARMIFGDVEESVVTRDEVSLEKARAILESETIAVIGYGVQGPAQALNLRDNGFRVIIGQRQGGASWNKAVADGWIPGETLFSIEEAAKKGTIVLNLLSDAGQIETWPAIKAGLSAGKALAFSHGFGIVFSEDTKIVPPSDIDVFLVAPKGSGMSVRRLFQQGKGINSSFAIHQDATGRAHDRVTALGIGVGSGYLFETTFQKEVVSDLVGERGILMGALAGVIEAQYRLLRAHGHSPSEAFNETVEELTQSLVPLVGENGMDWMFSCCSTTAQRGALDWRHKFREAVAPVFDELYENVASGREAKHVIAKNGESDYRAKLDKELAEVAESELWRAGRQVRALRPKA
jgi:ketol-acid reductoisomerase